MAVFLWVSVAVNNELGIILYMQPIFPFINHIHKQPPRIPAAVVIEKRLLNVLDGGG